MATKSILQLVSRDELLTEDILRGFLHKNKFIAFKFLQPEKTAQDDAQDVIRRCGLKMTRSGGFKWQTVGVSSTIAFFKVGINKDNMYIFIGPKDETKDHTYWTYTDPYGDSPIIGPAFVTYQDLQKALSTLLTKKSDEDKFNIMMRVVDDIEAGKYPIHAQGGSNDYGIRVPRFAPLDPPSPAGEGGVDQDWPDHVTRMNNDGAPMKPGKGVEKRTLYCGQYKKTDEGEALKNCFASGKCPRDARCGPFDGWQCIACQISQDHEEISNVTLENCHETFLAMFKDKLTTGNVSMVVNTPRYRPEFCVDHAVCSVALNDNRSCKVVVMTALEMLEGFCKDTQFKIVNIHSTQLSIDSCCCHVDMSCVPLIKPPAAAMRGANANTSTMGFSVIINCNYYEGEGTKGRIQEGWRGSHVQCSFELPCWSSVSGAYEQTRR